MATYCEQQKQNSDERWNKVKQTLAVYARGSWLLTVLVIFGLPIVEGILINVVTSASSPRWPLVLALSTVVVVHLTLGAIIALKDALLPTSSIADAVELERLLDNTKRELCRREEAYRMVCAAITQLNNETCALTSGMPTCDAKFEDGCRKVIDQLLQNISTVLGIRGRRKGDTATSERRKGDTANPVRHDLCAHGRVRRFVGLAQERRNQRGRESLPIKNNLPDRSSFPIRTQPSPSPSKSPHRPGNHIASPLPSPAKLPSPCPPPSTSKPPSSAT